MINRIQLWDFNFLSAKSYNLVVHKILNKQHLWNVNRYPILITPNSDQIVKFESKKYRKIKEKLKKAYLVLPDGQPIVWVSKMLKNPIHKRLTGSDFFPMIWKEAKERKMLSLFVVASRQIGEDLQKEHENLVYLVAPDIKIDTELKLVAGNEIVEQMVDVIEKNMPLLVFIGLGFPKQEIITLEVIEILKARNYQNLPFFMLLGASFEYYLHIKKRAPVWMRNLGLEWLYRLLQEPKRLWKRYLVSNAFFIFLAIALLINHKLQKTKRKD